MMNDLGVLLQSDIFPLFTFPLGWLQSLRALILFRPHWWADSLVILTFFKPHLWAHSLGILTFFKPHLWVKFLGALILFGPHWWAQSLGTAMSTTKVLSHGIERLMQYAWLPAQSKARYRAFISPILTQETVTNVILVLRSHLVVHIVVGDWAKLSVTATTPHYFIIDLYLLMF